ncbi:cytochrome P450 [Aspergillus eucalypticola CBS 122712]|uniref:Cytochrome P450 n=1 Tax=Aspergillus eucalypticola (strain CBS 122712 / IBT 29274) TaxID=1448314 RepID=A0A317VGQ2_ASPEC|nr:cytochrome P450 [Aspergillus eucalypticola CBS 122712]PWY73544.1 cytochrome P450 [Aspergillus eucalypticola CBS 122712]
MSGSSDLPKYPFARSPRSYNPPAELGELRRQGPTERVQLFDGKPAWIITRHKEVCEMLNSDRLSNERYNRDGYPEIHSGTKKEGVRPTFVHMDAPKHERHSHDGELFAPEATEALKPQIQEIVDGLIDLIKDRGCKDGPIDLVIEFAAMVNPKAILLLIFKVPEKETNKIIQASSALSGTSGTASESGHTDLHDLLSQLVDERIKKPGSPQEDLISKLVIEQYRLGSLDRDDLIILVYMILVAGNSAIESSIALGVTTLLQNQDQLRELRDKPELAGQIVEEILRYHTPSALNSRRVAMADLRLGGKEITAGTSVIGFVRSANRDERLYSDADKFDIHRHVDPHQNLAFGYGPHNCQGQWLSRLELQVVFSTLFRRLPNLKLAIEPSELEYTPPTQNVGVVHLPVVF